MENESIIFAPSSGQSTGRDTPRSLIKHGESGDLGITPRALTRISLSLLRPGLGCSGVWQAVSVRAPRYRSTTTMPVIEVILIRLGR